MILFRSIRFPVVIVVVLSIAPTTSYAMSEEDCAYCKSLASDPQRYNNKKYRETCGTNFFAEAVTWASCSFVQKVDKQILLNPPKDQPQKK